MQTSTHSRKFAVDANVILSAVAGKAALKVFLKEGIEFVTTMFNIGEVREYLGVFAAKYDLQEEVLESQLKLLPMKAYERSFYGDFIVEAACKMSGKDEDDLELLALAMKLKVPVWSNDNDFKHCGIEVYTTAKLLKALKGPAEL